MPSVRCSYGWRSALVVPGAVGVVFAVIAFLGLRPFDPPKPTTKTSFSDIVQALQKDVFTSPAMWCMGIGYFFISIIRTAVSTWAFSMLTNNPVRGSSGEGGGMREGGARCRGGGRSLHC
jgi:sugar phosphate permease